MEAANEKMLNSTSVNITFALLYMYICWYSYIAVHNINKLYSYCMVGKFVANLVFLSIWQNKLSELIDQPKGY